MDVSNNIIESLEKNKNNLGLTLRYAIIKKLWRVYYQKSIYRAEFNMKSKRWKGLDQKVKDKMKKTYNFLPKEFEADKEFKSFYQNKFLDIMKKENRNPFEVCMVANSEKSK